MPLTSQSLCGERDKIVVCEENKRKYIANNVDQNIVRKYRVDGDVIKSNNPRCDYLVSNEEKKTVYFVELKGRNIDHAITQIDSTIRELIGCFSNYKLHIRIVLSKATQNVSDNRYVAYRTKKNKMGICVKNKCKELKEDI